ncbi:MAG: hypothetical protein EPO24_02675 [Bacteroidetes bacterium]|nr:MAG: hypothetical protein EPO24_02675 [Bacteroidota bacterium]
MRLKISTMYSTIIILFLVIFTVSIAAQEKPFFPEGKYNASVTTPDAFLGFPLGQRPARYDQVVRYLQTIASQSSRVKMFEMGETYERRKQYYLVISSEENQKKIEELQRNNLRLADPRKTSAEEARQIIDANPAVVWIGYGIHGDELSSVDAAMQIIYQLAAGTDEATLRLLNELVICLDPMENPDGRERWLAQMQQWAGSVANSDAQSMNHSGTWPWGRGNHYLFDLNRDWFMLVNVENQNRLRALHGWYPQVLIDSHEMGAFDTYLFSPPREPLNPNVPEHIKKWWAAFAADQAKAFDTYGWSYYTREWNDEWYPGYGSSYGLYIDAVGILYEQAGTDGSSVKRPDGTTLSYREAVHHHVVSSWANFSTTAANRKNILSDYYASRRAGIVVNQGEAKAYYLLPGENPARVQHLVERLLMQNIEVATASAEFRIHHAQDYWGSKPISKTCPAGTYIISLDQPNGRLAKAILEFDPRMTNEVLFDERRSLEKDKDSKMYDVSAWSLPIAYGVEAYRTPDASSAASTVVTEIPKVQGNVQNPKPLFGFLFEYSDDHAVDALARLLEKGYRVRSARYKFTVEGVSYPASTLLLRLNENNASLVEEIQRIASSAGITVRGVNTALSSEGPDLGGNDFIPLSQPRIAILAGPEISSNSFGTIWKLLDEELTLRVSVLHTSGMNWADLKKYNVIILPSADGGGLNRVFGKGGPGVLREWVEGGGTLIGVANAASYLADTASAMSGVRIRQQSLKDFELFTKAVESEQKAKLPLIDSVSIWEGKLPPKDTAKKTGSVSNEKELAAQDERDRLFMPRGAIMRVDLDDEHWMSYGVGDKVPALMFTSLALMSKEPVETPARFSGYESIRLSGLVWPEARSRWASTSYATREGKGKGQIVLFVNEPTFRGGFYGTERMLLNAILLGPGFGADHPVEW